MQKDRKNGVVQTERRNGGEEEKGRDSRASPRVIIYRDISSIHKRSPLEISLMSHSSPDDLRPAQICSVRVGLLVSTLGKVLWGDHFAVRRVLD